MTKERFYEWGGKLNIVRGSQTDEEVAGEVRMLMRSDLNHERVCTMARDRIMCLLRELKQARDICKEASDYLDTNQYTNIGHGSILHDKLNEEGYTDAK